MKKLVLLIALPLLSGSSALVAEPIANWKELNPNAIVVPITDARTNSPIFGDGVTENSSQMAWIAGRFGTVEAPALVNLTVGETLTVKGSVVMTGGTSNNNQFRFGLFNDGGKFALDEGSNWVGGWLHSIGDVESSDLWQGRTDGPFISTYGDAIDLDSVKTLTGLFDGDSAEAFTFMMSITRDSESTIDIISLIEGGDGDLSERFEKEDIQTSMFTYSSMGWLFGGSSGVERVDFLDVEYSVTSGEEALISLEIRSDGAISELDYKVDEADLYLLESSLDLINWSIELDDAISGAGTFVDDLSIRFEAPFPPRVYYRLRKIE